MPLVVALLFMWISVHAVAALPHKLPLQVNVLLYMTLSVIDINKFTLLSFTYRVFEIDLRVPAFLAAIVHRDFTFTLALLLYANAFLTARNRAGRTPATIGVFLFLLGNAQALRWTGVIRDVKWNLFYECLMIAALMGIALGLGAALRKLWEKGAGELGPSV